MFPVLNIGSLAIQVPGLILIIGLWIGINIAEKTSKLFQVENNELYNITFLILASGLIGGRLSYVATHLEAFQTNPSSILSINPGLFDLTGGVFIATIIFLIYTQRKSLDINQILNALTPLMATVMVAIPTANLASGNGFGKPSSLPWSIYLWGTYRHPTQIYEMIAGILILIYTLYSIKNKPEARNKTFLLFLISTSLAYVFLGYFRGDSVLLFNRFRQSQIIAWIFSAIGFWLYNRDD